jgi:hypothetical protein
MEDCAMEWIKVAFVVLKDLGKKEKKGTGQSRVAELLRRTGYREAK